MATRDSIVQVPFIGGVDEGADPDQLQAPAMKSLVNVTTRKPGRIEKRAGFEFLAQTGSTTVPATTFGGASAVLPLDVEAVGAYNGADGTRTIVAAGNELFEHVGADASHGWRYVNRLPSCLGTLQSVSPMGGDVIEVESMLNDAGTLRCTVWVAGTRNGQERTNDSAINNQSITTAGVYVAVQRVLDGTFVTPPTRLDIPGGGPTNQCCDLRMCLVMPIQGTIRNWVIAFRWAYSAIVGVVVDSTTAAIYSSQALTGFVGREYHRSFDITGVPNDYQMLIATCGADTVGVPSGVKLELRYITVAGTFSGVVVTLADVVVDCDAQNFVAGAFTWLGYAARGVVLETDPISAASIGIGIRLVYESTVLPKKLDGKILVARIAVGVSPPSITVASTYYGLLHRVGFKTDEATVGSFGNVGGVFYTASVSLLQAIYSPAPYHPVPLGVPTVYVTGIFPDGTKEVYVADVLQSFGFSIGNFSPDKATELPKITQAGYARVPHVYLGTARQMNIGAPVGVAAVVTGSIKINKQQVVKVVIDVAHGILAANGWVVTGTLYNGVTAWCSVQINCQLTTGLFTEVAIVNGNPGNPVTPLTPAAAGTQATSFLITSAINVGGLGLDPTSAVAYPINGGGAMHMMLDYLNTSNNYTIGFYATDIGDQTAVVVQPAFDGLLAPEACVHRWDVKTSLNAVVLAVSSTSAGLMSNPNGAPPLGYASPFAENNFFEVYEWDGTARKQLNVYGGGTASTMWTALGGPWRMISSLVDLPNGRIACVVSPSGDAFQQSAALISFARPLSLAEVNTPKPYSNGGGSKPNTAEGYLYTGGTGVFVESLNMARTANLPLNCPRLTYNSTTKTALVGAIRGGQGAASTEIFAIDYIFGASVWRTAMAWGDYTAVNGGVVTTFDGTGSGEVASFMWPQQDMVGAAYERVPTKLYSIDRASTGANASAVNGPDSFYDPSSQTTAYLTNIKRPWFAYEAGLNDAYGYSAIGNVSIGWALMSTLWGGKATDNYEAVYTDPRLAQLSSMTSLSPQGGLTQAASQHYYGRYQSGYSTDEITTTGNERMVVWAPRQNLGVAGSASDYTAIVANGDFLARWCYEWADGTGRTARSSPSVASTFTVCSRIRYAAGTYGGTIDEFRYGFFVPRLELTNRLTTAIADVRRVVLQPYFTAEPFATVLYKVPTSSFLVDYQDSLVVPRNSTRGVVPYSGGPIGVNPNGIVTSNFRCFDGPQGNYNGILSQPYLYTTGGVLDNVCPPAALCMCIHQNRLVLGGADDTTVVWFSKELSPTDAPGFNDALTIQIEEGGAVTGLASFNGLLFVFKRRTAFVVAGDMPDDTGGGIGRGNGSISSLATPVRMAHDIGCINHRSVVETPIGIFFQSERTLELLDQNMSITPVGFALEETMATFPEVTNAIHHPKDNEVWFTVHTVGAAGAAGEQFRVLVFNYLTKQWSTSKFGAIGTGRVQLGLVDNRPCLAATGAASGVVYRQTPSKFFDVAPTGRQYVAMSGTTAPVALNQIQGYERVKRLRVFGNPVPSLSTGAAQTREPHGFSMMLQSDFKNTGVFSAAQTATWTQSESLAVWTDQSREVYEVHLANQKCQQVVLSFAETAPSDITTLTHGYGTSLSNMALVVGLKSGLDKKVTSDAKH